ncbi:TetR/AcrR family transcriptional regulator [Kordiimonas aestuarii]|uniref:TetR/AcrR family transcriptional regulator n=1 Tax=Kordiimonas aestuarii TaxID=1005925 RepID=UPI0021CEE8ED|nr:TetR/AcrR family transcriptional regulator [Kordiimonas aestuarii]
MPRIAKYTKTGMAERLTLVFKAYGYEGASLSMLADAVGLSKASLYHHFPGGKVDMAAHVLAHSGARLQRFVLAPLLGKGRGADRIGQSLEGTAHYYDGDMPICLMNSLLLGEGRAHFGARIEGAVAAWTAGLASAMREAGGEEPEAWSHMVIERVQGALVLCRVRGHRWPLESCLENLGQV